KCVETTGAPEVAMFRLGRTGLPPGRQGGEVSTLMEELAAKAGLRPVSIAIRRGSVFAAFERAEQRGFSTPAAAYSCPRLDARGPAGPICQTHPRIPCGKGERVANVSRAPSWRARSCRGRMTS